MVDGPVALRIIEILKPENLKIALKALSEVEARNDAVAKQWKMTIERAEYEVNIAQRRYEEVDPSNRLVAATLERKWNDALVKLEQTKQEFEKITNENNINLTPEKKKDIMALATNLPKLWNSPTTNPKDKKRIIRLLIEDITVKKDTTKRVLTLQLRWKGGACEEIQAKLPEKIRYKPEVIDKVRQLAEKHPDGEIAEILTNEGWVSARGKAFTKSMISWIRYKHNIQQFSKLNKNEFTVKQVQKKFGISNHMVYYWIENDYVTARKAHPTKWLITIDADKEIELNQRIENSYRL